MYLARLTLNQSRTAIFWSSNPYRVHQRLRMAYSNDPRLLFRIEESSDGTKTQILVQSHTEPDWSVFTDFPVLLSQPEHRFFNPKLVAGHRYRFRILANPTLKKTLTLGSGEKRKTRLGLFREEAQVEWLRHKLNNAGSEMLACRVIPRGLQYSHKNPAKDDRQQTHLAVMYEGILRVNHADLLQQTLKIGIGSAKGYGFGLLSLAPLREWSTPQ
jgi:CRISPR system Cascade subunit CasE